jgi:hypothetical protein
MYAEKKYRKTSHLTHGSSSQLIYILPVVILKFETPAGSGVGCVKCNNNLLFHQKEKIGSPYLDLVSRQRQYPTLRHLA